MVVSRDIEGARASVYGDRSWNLGSMSTDGSSPITLNFYEPQSTDALELELLINDQHKALMWLHMDAGKQRAPRTIMNTNFALASWCDRAFSCGVDLYTLLTNPEWVTEGAQDMNTNYVDLTASALRTLWRHRDQLNAPAELQLKALRDALNKEARGRPETQQTPLIPSRIYSAVLASLVGQMSQIEGEVDSLLTTLALGGAADGGSGAASRLGQHQMVLMLIVAAFSGMRLGEVSILPLDNVLVPFEHIGSTHFELHGFTHKLNSGVKRPTSWITSGQGARAVRLAQKIASAVRARHGKAAKAGQTALLFPTMSDAYKKMSAGSVNRRINRIRESLCPIIAQSDIEELDSLELARGWTREGIEVGKPWPLAFHQLRRSLAVYAHRSGIVSLPGLKAQLQHITQEMSMYYTDGFSRAVNMVFDENHFSKEWQAAKAESSYFAYALGFLFSDDEMFGRGAERMANTVESRSREDTFRLFEQGKLAYRETPLGGCVSTEQCKLDPLEPIPFHCLETNCVNQIVYGKRLEHVIRSQELTVASFGNDDQGCVEHRLEARNLEVLLKARERFMETTNGRKKPN